MDLGAGNDIVDQTLSNPLLPSSETFDALLINVARAALIYCIDEAKALKASTRGA
jgi:hypothetical protein